MVGPLMMLKMLHCKQYCSQRKKTRKSKFNNGSEKASEKIQRENIIKVEQHSEEMTICRVCLKEGYQYIQLEGNTSNDLIESINTFGDIEIKLNDGHPKHLCQPCYALLQGAILFRETAKRSEEILKKISPEKCDTLDLEENISDSGPDEDNEAPFILDNGTEKSLIVLSCKRCNLDFSSFQEYSTHRLSSEHETKKYLCSICKNFYVPEYYKKHMALHNQTASYMCDICGKKFAVQSHFSRHRLTHFNNLPFKCSQCPYRGRFSESLKMHMRSHTGEKPYQCAQCPSRFINKSNLNKHMLTHKGEHDFRCEVCGRGFYTKRELEMHIKVDHTGIKEHICRICGKAFGYRKQMMKHELRVHKRQKMKSGRMPIYMQLELKQSMET